MEKIKFVSLNVIEYYHLYSFSFMCIIVDMFCYIQARYWRAYVEAQMNANNDDATKQIFSRCLLNCLHVDLWYV